MSKQPNRRGRSAAPQRQQSPMLIFYGLIGLIVLVGVGFLATTTLQQKQATPDLPVVSGTSAPTGKTSDNAFFKGNSDAKVVVTEYSDFQ